MDEIKKESDESKAQEEIVKITITNSAGEALKELVAKVNHGFEAGRIHRQDLASWIISSFAANHSEDDLAQIRELHFNDTVMLEAVSRQMKETGELPDFIRSALRKHFQAKAESPKKSKKTLSKEYINDVLQESGGAVERN